MSLVSIEGPLKKVNRALRKCRESGCFHIMPAAESADSSHAGPRSFTRLKDRNTYAQLLKRYQVLASRLGITLTKSDFSSAENMSSGGDFDAYAAKVEHSVENIMKQREDLIADADNLKQVVRQLEFLEGLKTDFRDIFPMKTVKIRFGRITEDGFKKFDFYKDKPYIFVKFKTEKERLADYIWGVYFTPTAVSEEIDEIFRSLSFERVRMPDFLEGKAADERTRLISEIEAGNKEISRLDAEIKAIAGRHTKAFNSVYSKLESLYGAAALRQNVSAAGSRFYISGYVLARKSAEFERQFEEIGDITLMFVPPSGKPDDNTLSPPVKLRNNVIIRPFEMFVRMYGLPEYGGIDPTPFIALTYMLFYGIMFADVGQGLALSILGFILAAKTKFALAPIMSRIGLAGAAFGILNGSIFGNEEILTPFFRYPTVYSALGLSEAPHSVFSVSAALIIGTLGIGVVMLIVTILMNTIIATRRGDYESGLFGPSGLAGFVLYGSVIVAALAAVTGNSILNPVYVICLFLLPLASIFFKETLAHKMKQRDKRSKLASAANDRRLSEAIKRVTTDGAVFELSGCGYVGCRYGSLSLEGYGKLNRFSSLSFCFFPTETDGYRVSGYYAAPNRYFPSTDRLMTLLGFRDERSPYDNDDKKLTAQYEPPAHDEAAHHEKPPLGEFLIGGFIELFESGLSYLTNTVSFLRIGGFVLSHAGLMLVVAILAEKAGAELSPGWIVVMILGNLFVMGMEGFLVGIQALRLEYYELFSRFYSEGGKAFQPLTADFIVN